ncbi:MAG: RND transporter [Rhodobacteraceae bacterium]|uniref:RND transporter n=1 Tax=Celeribacter sp. HF31 TaxID=2721558 RepID=UPI001430C578|nr:RND transporter [Celeribacter sp. HF31]NIY81133.1 RND transporter [Celeribacter sp. HF31]NVK46406.1 RND transporter [Paracoccaceae bacterium]
MKFIDSLPLSTLIFASLTLGLAPFVPEPHVWEKLKMLFSGTLVSPIDIFDLLLHGLPWLLLILKLWREYRSVKGASED